MFLLFRNLSLRLSFEPQPETARQVGNIHYTSETGFLYIKLSRSHGICQLFLLAWMAQFASVFLSALVALLSIHLLLANAAPLMLDWVPEESMSIWDTPPLVAAAPDSGISDVVEFAPKPFGTAIAGIESTVTQWETTTVTMQPTPTTVPTEAGSQPQSWVLPEDFTDLSPFSIDRIAYGSTNIAVVTGIPAEASGTIPSPGSPTPVSTPSALTDLVLTSSKLPRLWTNSSSAYRLFFPSGSINPGNKPQGGSDFYATPLSVQSATNVTLQYSIFFPADFEWVHGGKLPGLYGGHGGCSGGNSAKTCFSTRMMWRQGGAGELYLVCFRNIRFSRRADQVFV